MLRRRLARDAVHARLVIARLRKARARAYGLKPESRATADNHSAAGAQALRDDAAKCGNCDNQRKDRCRFLRTRPEWRCPCGVVPTRGTVAGVGGVRFVDEIGFAFGWIAPEPRFMQRASHAVAAHGRV
jgi:hypothetical protein